MGTAPPLGTAPPGDARSLWDPFVTTQQSTGKATTMGHGHHHRHTAHRPHGPPATTPPPPCPPSNTGTQSPEVTPLSPGPPQRCGPPLSPTLHLTVHHSPPHPTPGTPTTHMGTAAPGWGGGSEHRGAIRGGGGGGAAHTLTHLCARRSLRCTHPHTHPRITTCAQRTQVHSPAMLAAAGRLHAQPFARSAICTLALTHAPRLLALRPTPAQLACNGAAGLCHSSPPRAGAHQHCTHTHTHTHTCATVSTFAPTCARAAEHTHVCTGGHEGSKRIRERTRGHRRTWAPPVGMVTLSPHVSPHPPTHTSGGT